MGKCGKLKFVWCDCLVDLVNEASVLKSVRSQYWPSDRVFRYARIKVVDRECRSACYVSLRVGLKMQQFSVNQERA